MSVYNFNLAREIYGGTPWFIDMFSYQTLNEVLRDIKSGVEISVETKNNTPLILCPESVGGKTKYVYYPWQLRNENFFEAIGVIRIDGPITNSGGSSSYGMLDLSSMMFEMTKDERVKGFIILGNSGGGSSIAVETMTDTIDEIRKTKEVYGLIEKGGMATSAMQMILCACKEIYASSEMSIVGSFGTMIQFSGRKANTQDPDGMKHIRLYATKSVKKNEDFEQALNEDNYDLMINNLLNPINERALAKALEYRPQLANSGYDDGRDLFAKDGIGTYIDGIATMEEVTQMVLNSPVNFPGAEKGVNNNKLDVKPKSSKMTIDELKSQHPETYNAIFKAGVDSERDRAGAWLAHVDADQKTVVEGIKSGNQISNTDREELFVKGNSKKSVEQIAEDSPTDLDTPQKQSTGKKEDEEAEAAEFYKSLDA